MTVYVVTCDEANFTPASTSSTGVVTGGTCSAPYYAPQPSFIPPLSMTAGAAIGMAILATWAVAAGWKSLSRVWS